MAVEREARSSSPVGSPKSVPWQRTGTAAGADSSLAGDGVDSAHLPARRGDPHPGDRNRPASRGGAVNEVVQGSNLGKINFCFYLAPFGTILPLNHSRCGSARL
jgi:hypothetical protein